MPPDAPVVPVAVDPAAVVPVAPEADVVVVVVGATAGAGVTFGVGSGVFNETYGSSTTFAGRTMWSWLVAAPTIREGVSRPETDSSAWRCVLCSSDS